MKYLVFLFLLLACETLEYADNINTIVSQNNNDLQWVNVSVLNIREIMKLSLSDSIKDLEKTAVRPPFAFFIDSKFAVSNCVKSTITLTEISMFVNGKYYSVLNEKSFEKNFPHKTFSRGNLHGYVLNSETNNQYILKTDEIGQCNLKMAFEQPVENFSNWFIEYKFLRNDLQSNKTETAGRVDMLFQEKRGSLK